VNFGGQMVIIIKEHLKITIFLVKEYLDGLMGKIMMENGKIIKCMVMEYMSIRVGKNI